MPETVLSGLRPTGRVHLGNYFGAVKNWVDLQNSGKYRCFFFVADLHALTTDYADTAALANHTREAVLDWLAVGLDPSVSTIFLQSRVPQSVGDVKPPMLSLLRKRRHARIRASPTTSLETELRV